MRFARFLLAAILLGAALYLWKTFSPESGEVPVAPRRSDRSSENVAAPSSGPAALVSRAATLAQFGYGSGWNDSLPAPLAAFREWTERFEQAPADAREGMLAEGIALARQRRGAMRELIASDPQRALAVTVPAAVRVMLPAAVLAELETRVAAQGELARVTRPIATTNGPGCALVHRALLNGVTYTAHVYGRREAQTWLEGVSLHGIALEGHLALHESPLRALEPGESLSLDDAGENCPVSGLPVSSRSADAGAILTAPGAAEVNGRTLEFCAGSDDMLERFARQLEAAEDAATLRVVGTPARAAEAPTPWTTGTKQVLVIRVDFADFPGEPISQAAALNVLENNVRPFLEQMSYGQTSVVGTVSDVVYRMPQTGAAYATADNDLQLHTDARNAARAHYTLENFDRIVVVFTSLSPSRVPGSAFGFAGQASPRGANVWINGASAFNFATVTHELGHTYGLLHSNLWRTTDGNPVSASGTSVEYGDPFDMMGSSATTGVTRDTRHHFNGWHKNRLGWLPDAAVINVTASGTYRIFRFDGSSAPQNQPLALKIFRDGVRWYWVGLRQGFVSGFPQAAGAYVVWGFNGMQSSQLLDIGNPGGTANDAALPVGATFSDPAYGIAIKAVQRGGSGDGAYLDLEVTVPGTTPSVVAAWGRDGADFFSAATGLPTSPAPETYAPPGLVGVRAIAGGDQHVVALKTDGTVIAWGDHVAGQTTVPAGLNNVVAVAAGGDTSGAVRSDGSVLLWGANASGQTNVPSGLNNVRQLAIGRNHVLALRFDGTVVAWGANNAGQSTVPAGAASDVVAIATGTEFSLALKRDGTVVSWGSSFGRPPNGLAGVVAISAAGVLTGGQFAVALKSDGTLVAWGANNSQQTVVPPGLNNVVAIAAGAFHTVCLKADGSIESFGVSSGGRTATPLNLPRARAVAATAAGSFALVGTGIYFTEQPANQTIAAGGVATFRVAAGGASTFSYQWQKDGVPIPGANAATLTLTNVSAASAGSYRVVVNDLVGSLATVPVQLVVTPAAPAPETSRIANLSIRTHAGIEAQTLIVGFVIGGAATSGTKPLVVRGAGPSLAAFGVSGFLADPRLEIYGPGSVKLFENDNWLAGDGAIFTSVGAFAFPAGSRDAALYRAAMNAGTYSAQLSGVGGTSGVALAEIYDGTASAGFGASTPRLVNVSARARSGTGGEVLIAGFAIAGPNPKRVLIRGIGPSLTAFGVTDVLANPKLELFNSASVKMQENDDWSGTAALAAAFGAVGAFELDPASRDAALLVELSPGSYTAQVSGIGGTTGVALVELYEVP